MIMILGTHNMTGQIEAKHDLTPNEIDAIEDRLYHHDSYATGRHDGRGLGFVIRDEMGQMIGVAAGFTWSGTSKFKQMWIDEAYRGRGYARALLNAFIEEACSRGVCRIWVASYDFQAPAFYEKAGFKRIAEFEGWPEGHINVILCKTLSDQETSNAKPRPEVCFESSKQHPGMFV
jgi:GNAT superfamily N-acetyltransferase